MKIYKLLNFAQCLFGNIRPQCISVYLCTDAVLRVAWVKCVGVLVCLGCALRSNGATMLCMAFYGLTGIGWRSNFRGFVVALRGSDGVSDLGRLEGYWEGCA